MSDVEEFLAHYGVKGMKWGVRKKSGKRPTAGQRLAKSRFGTLSKKNLSRHYKRQSKRTEKQGPPRSRSKAQKTANFIRTASQVALVTALVAPSAINAAAAGGRAVKNLAGVGMDQAILKKMASNQAKAGAAWMADNRGLDAMKIIDI